MLVAWRIKINQSINYYLSCNADGSTGVRAEAFQYVTVNEAPKLGICSISPDSGTELDTIFSAACHSWNDEVGIIC